MCFRTVFWEDSGAAPDNARTLSVPLVCERGEPPQSHTAPKGPLAPVLEDVLDFLKGISGLKPST